MRFWEIAAAPSCYGLQDTVVSPAQSCQNTRHFCHRSLASVGLQRLKAAEAQRAHLHTRSGG